MNQIIEIDLIICFVEADLTRFKFDQNINIQF